MPSRIPNYGELSRTMPSSWWKTFTKQVSEQSNWQEETIEEIGLTFKHPKDLVYRKEIADDNGRIRTAGFFLTKGSENNPEYQMYGLYQQYRDATEQDLELAKRRWTQIPLRKSLLMVTKA